MSLTARDCPGCSINLESHNGCSKITFGNRLKDYCGCGSADELLKHA